MDTINAEVYRPGSYPTMLEDMQAAQLSWEGALQRMRLVRVQARDAAVRELVERAAAPRDGEVIALGSVALGHTEELLAA